MIKRTPLEDKPEEWDEPFETLFGYGSKEDMKSFIKSEIRKVEERKDDDIQKVIDRYKNSYPRPAGIIEALEALKK
jgi:hypothetical protein